MGGMINDLSEKFSSDVSGALANASDSIELAGRKIGELAARMDQSSGNMNEQLMASIATLTTTLGDIRKNTEDSAARTGEVFREGAEKMLAVMSETLQDSVTIRDAVPKPSRMRLPRCALQRKHLKTNCPTPHRQALSRSKARWLRRQMPPAGPLLKPARKYWGPLGRPHSALQVCPRKMADRLSGDLLRPLDDIGEKLSTLSRELGNGTSEFRRLAEGVKRAPMRRSWRRIPSARLLRI